jgi:DNA-binding transcriptional MocR family regulator
VSEFINSRDDFGSSGGVSADPEKIFLTSGASEGVKYVIDLLISQVGRWHHDPHPAIPALLGLD